MLKPINKQKLNKDAMLAVRVSDETYAKFKEICNENKLTISDALSQLIDLAIKKRKPKESE